MMTSSAKRPTLLYLLITSSRPETYNEKNIGLRIGPYGKTCLNSKHRIFMSLLLIYFERNLRSKADFSPNTKNSIKFNNQFLSPDSAESPGHVGVVGVLDM
ncbi:hypothetical protein TNCV_194771 [Trichonephila clavipes]|nr:hypothetical protein TNCV_1713991 [Trichonephila clavipes]GFX02499.1 hypothetical protein TNCV_194771 [Trichonephila clavipes]